ncbi:uncharacterized protein HHUB_4208 (plasmid) [Halobacterium hubeiense]|uniref:Uncharacterized protein n=1 Tax=Halobacterium hubeiense TaxID=1407499 RepID=A0A0U5H6E9_9EURY|nr:uncharacterized protein HHUB_4208 [Halobacterium hubeiense]
MSGRNAADTDGQSENGATPRGLQPRVVLALVLVAALGGAWLTHRGQPLATKLLPWATAVTTGALAGGVYWRLVLFDADAFDRAEHRRAVRARWRRLETALVWAVTLSSGAYLVAGTTAPVPGFGRPVVVAGTVAVVACWYGHRRFGDARTNHRKRALRAGVFTGSVAVIAGFAWLETATTTLDWVVRLGHVAALAVWLGGAVWHNFVVLPTIRAHPDAAAAVKSQAHAFRRHLPVVIVVLFATGVYQTGRLVGYSMTALTGTTVGHVVTGKLVVLAALTGLVAINVKKNP